MKSKSLSDSKRGLEEEFFHRESERQISELRAQLARQESRQALEHASGLSDPQLLDRLMELGVTAETSTLLNLVPVIAVAWADGAVQTQEREAILAGAKEEGITQGTPSYDLLLNWLEEQPGPRLFSAWEEYVQGLVAQLEAEQVAMLREQIASFALNVAKAAGGILGIGSVSSSEEAVLARVNGAFATS